MKIAVGSDHAGTILKGALIKHLEEKGIEYKDFGVSQGEKAHYPNIAQAAAEAVAAKEYDLGLLICGSGVGMAITANKVRGVRAVVCSEPYSALLSRQHNDTNVLALGERVVGAGLGVMILDAWLTGEFQGGRHQERVGLITKLEN